ncbi:MAG: Dihydrofolate reductase [Candidatus Saccharibacteria bacterium]|nr:Dihydrofolate reductase [Candidatus Saccharibacteria bacterium]
MGDIPKNLLHHWMFDEPEKHKAELSSLLDAKAFIMGTNMFVPPDKRNDADWKGWWGDTPPYHAPVFVLVNHAQEPIAMAGGTTFNFVTGGIVAALQKAKLVAGDGDISVAGGASTINQYLAAGLLDEVWLHIVPVLIGSGAKLFKDTPGLQLKPVETRTTDLVTHVRYEVLHTLVPGDL